jgi:adenylate cyclase
VIGDAVNEAARLSEKAKGQPGGVLASGAAVRQAGESEQAAWRLLGEQQLRGRSRPTELAVPLAGAGAGPAADGSRPAPEPATS